MKTQSLIQTAQALLASNKGILAMDESTNTCNKRFAPLNIPQTEEARRAYREMLITTPRLGDCISGVILHDETIRQQSREGVPFVNVITSAGIIPGIKVDTGVKDLAGSPGERLPRDLMVCVSASSITTSLEHALRNGVRFSPSTKTGRAEHARNPMPMT